MARTKGISVEKRPEQLRLTANLYWEDGQYIAECAEIGTVSQGDTPEEAVDNLRAAVEGYLQAFPDALDTKRELVPYVERARALEQAYAEHIGEAIEPADIKELGSTSFTVEPVYA
jgi:predicted RNase H-like HicB family nuclease